MSNEDYSTKSRKFHHLTEIQRGKIEAMVKLKVSKVQIAIKVGISRSTLYEELKRGTVAQMNSDLTIREKYFADVSQRVCGICRRKNLKRTLVTELSSRLRKEA